MATLESLRQEAEVKISSWEAWREDPGIYREVTWVEREQEENEEDEGEEKEEEEVRLLHHYGKRQLSWT